MSELDGPMAVSLFDSQRADDAVALLESCCGSSAWVRDMLARRPFGTIDRLLAEADAIWWSLPPDDWFEAFSHHPRIGERDAAVAQGARARGWSADEQHASSTAAKDTRAALALRNREYEQRFGHIYLVCATGKSAEDLLALLRTRLTNDPSTELRVAAGEQAKITRLRLQKLFAPVAEPTSRSPRA